MCKGEVVRQKHPSWGTPPRFLFDCAQRCSVLVRRRGDAAPLLSSARFSTYVSVHPAFSGVVLRGAELLICLIFGGFVVQHLKICYLSGEGDVKLRSLPYGFA